MADRGVRTANAPAGARRCPSRCRRIVRTMMRTGRDGYACAQAIRLTAGSAATPAARCRNLRRERFIGASQRVRCRRIRARPSLTTQRSRMLNPSFGYEIRTAKHNTCLILRGRWLGAIDHAPSPKALHEQATTHQLPHSRAQILTFTNLTDCFAITTSHRCSTCCLTFRDAVTCHPPRSLEDFRSRHNP